MAVIALTAIKPVLSRIAKGIVLLCSLGSIVYAQLPSPFPVAPPLVPVNPGFFGSQAGVGGSLPGFGGSLPNFGGVAPGFGGVAPGAVLQGRIQPFDPYAIPGGSGLLPPAPGQGLIGTIPGGLPSTLQGGLPSTLRGGLPGTLPSFGSGIGQGFLPSPTFSAPPPGVWPGTSSTFPSAGSLPSLPPGAPLTAAPPNLSAPYGAPLGGAPRTGGVAPTNRGGGLFGFGANSNANANDPFFRSGSGGFTNSGLGRSYANGNDLRFNNAQRQRGNRPPYQRLFQDTGLRGTYLWGEDKDDLEITEFEASTSAYFPNFLSIPEGLRVTPGFAFHWLDGPQLPETTAAPSRLYSAYLDFGIRPRFTPRFGAEVNARVGVYSDFQAFNGDSIRLIGSGIGIYRVTPEFAVKLGATYIDRVRVKLLPAGGILWTPNPQTRWDIFFPSPKLANYWTTINNKEIWWYLGGEYGGGSWSIEREVAPSRGEDDRMDINDIRVILGVEMSNLNRYYGFAEVGYVFDRDLVFFREPGDSIHVDETVMVRAGFAW